MSGPTPIGLIGCGSVSHQYLPNLLASPTLHVAAVSDVDPAVAAKVSDQYGIGAFGVDQLLADPDIEIVINLTPIKFHVAVSRSILDAGKHLYSEKSLAKTVAEAKELLATAEAKNLLIGGAPDTLLGTSFQAARRALEGGLVGKPLTATAIMLRAQMSNTAYFDDFNALFDMSPYYLSALVSLFGPARSVTGYVERAAASARDDEVGVGLTGVIEFVSGLAATLSVNWGSAYRQEIPVLDVYADSGVLRLGNPNNFGDPAFSRRHGDPDGAWQEIPGSRQPPEWAQNLRGLGVTEMAAALSDGRAPRASGQLACHVVDIIEGLVDSSASGRRVNLTTSCEPPESLTDNELISYIDPDRNIA